MADCGRLWSAEESVEKLNPVLDWIKGQFPAITGDRIQSHQAVTRALVARMEQDEHPFNAQGMYYKIFASQVEPNKRYNAD